ncbi:hypothetical protein CVS40_12343 [Lucilia cuprina]|nr:hypothetical protein CVS40_12343 [Lucilia cuprina]
MSTRKSTLASPTAQGTKVENASTSSPTSTVNTAKTLEKTNASSSSSGEKDEMGANASSNTNTLNPSDSKATEQNPKANQDTKPFLQRVTRNSPLLLASPQGAITIKKEPLDPNDHHVNSDSEEVGGTNTTTNTKKTNIRGRKSLKEHKELAEKEEEQEAKEKVKDKEESAKETKEEQNEKKEQSEQKDNTAPAQSTSTTTASNRLTRKSVANQEAANTRVTRQRQSSGASARSETPPARSRSGRTIGRNKMPVPMIDTTPAVTKRKRSVDVENAAVNKSTIDEPGPKYIKIEVKDPDVENEDILLSSQNTNASSEGVEESVIKIKQEILDESENELPATTESNTTTVSTAVTTNTNRSKGRNANRKSTNNTTTTTSTNNSPSTRATRQTKQTSPPAQSNNAPADTKRRRMGSQTRSLLKSNVGSNAKNQPTNGDDEDSKDSAASSTNTDDIVLALIKSEKISMELDDDNTNDAKDIPANVEKDEHVKTIVVTEESNDLPPLVVDTDVAQAITDENTEIVESAAALTPVAASCSSVASGSEKAASLSPSELVSEGVSEISVKQFYKKPKFLENNLGIEEDPKLGNIVQKVVGLETAAVVPPTTSTASLLTDTILKTDTTSAVPLLDESYSNESLKEGTLCLEESIEDKKLTTQDDSNSLCSSDNLTPLLIVEDDDEELEQEVEVKKNTAEITEPIDVEEPLQKTPTKQIVLNNAVEDETTKLTVITVDEEDNERDQDQEDELTLEESETISMDNNASINDEIITETEDPANEENIAEIEDFSDVTEAVENTSSKLSEPQDQIVEDKNKLVLKATSDVEKDHDFTKIELITNDKENITTKNTATEVSNSNVSVPTPEDEDNDVLAKIDAELKKIDERHKEKLVVKTEDKLVVPPLVLNITDDSVKESIDELIVSHESMDIDADIKLTAEEDTKNIAKEDGLMDEVLDIKLDDEQPLIIAEDIKLIEDKDKQEEEEDVGISSDMDSFLIEKKIEIKNSLIKASSDTEIENPNLNLIKDDDTTSMKSGQSATSWITLDLENDDEETLRKKELHLQNLGLVTHKAAQKRRLEVIQSSAANVEASKAATQHNQHNKRNGKNSSHAASTHHEYTGTLKTIIKINRNSTGGSTSGSNGRKSQNNTAGSSTSKEQQQQQRRQSLKMTFQKGRARAHGTGNNDRSQQDREGHGEDNYYTIQNETEGALHKYHSFPTTSTTSITRLALTHTNNNSNNIVKNLTTTYARKSYNYRYNHQHHTHHSATSNNTAHIYEMGVYYIVKQLTWL